MTLGNKIFKSALLLSLLPSAGALWAQSGGSSDSGSWLIWVAVVLGILAVIFVGDSLLKVEAKNTGTDRSGGDYSVFPRLRDIFGVKAPGFVSGPFHRLSKGHDIKLEGKAEGNPEPAVGVKRYAVKPTDFIGIAPIPKVTVAVGDRVKMGDPLFYNKKTADIKYCSPVSGTVVAINRGAKRAIVEVVIEGDAYHSMEYRDLGRRNVEGMSREEIVAFMAESGVWPMIKRRPFQTVADLAETPRDIFVSTFDSAPLAPDSNVVVAGRGAEFQKGLDILNKLTDGKVYLGLNAKDEPSDVFKHASGVEKHWFHGKHPAGNVGVQIHHIKPVVGQDMVWTLGVQEVISIGALFLHWRYNAERVVAVTGAELQENRYVRTFLGASVEGFLEGNYADDATNIRVVSGDVLSGTQIEPTGFLGFHDDQVTVLQEGDYHEMFGWLLPLAPRPSISRTFPSFLTPGLEYRADTNTHGEKRAFVVTGQYESVLPMDIYPQHLMKAIMANDIERMEGLGITELAEEDIALCEFVCTSKQPLQQILREGLDSLREQG